MFRSAAIGQAAQPLALGAEAIRVSSPRRCRGWKAGGFIAQVSGILQESPRPAAGPPSGLLRG